MKTTWIKSIIYISISLVIGFIVFMVSAFLITKPKYEANCMSYVAVILLEDEIELGYNAFLASIELANSYALYVSDTYMYKTAENELPNDLIEKYTYKDLQNCMKIKTKPGTFIINFKVVANNKEDAVALCNFYADYSLKEVKSLLGVGYFEVLEPANINSVTVKYNIFIYGLIGAALGGAIMGVLIYLKNKFNQKIRSTKDILESFPDVIVLGEL